MIDPETVSYALAGDPGTGIVALLLGLGVGTVLEIRERQRWREVGNDLGLKFTGALMFKKLRGDMDGFQVKIEPKGKHGHYKIKVDGRGAIPPLLSLGAETVFTRNMAEQDIQTGHPTFDYQARIHGRPEEAVALLDHKTRAMVLKEVVEGGIKVSDGGLYITKHKFALMTDLVRRMVKLGKQLSMNTRETPRRLAANVMSDPVSSVRQRNLQLLIERFADHPQSTEAARTALHSDHPATRLMAARFLGNEALDIVGTLILNKSVDNDLRIQGLRHYLKSAERDAALSLISDLLPEPPAGALQLIIQASARYEDSALMKRLMGYVEGLEDADAIHLATAMEKVGDESVEPGLLKLLERSSDRVKLAAARALTRVGSVAAVEPLMELTKGVLFLSNTELREAAQEAIEQIQSRLGDVDAGGLSLAAPSEHQGALSVAGSEDPRGALSFNGGAEKEGGLSLEEDDNDPDVPPVTEQDQTDSSK